MVDDGDSHVMMVYESESTLQTSPCVGQCVH